MSEILDRLSKATSQDDRLKFLVDLGIALSSERNRDRLLETILLGAKRLTNADGGTLYLRTESNGLRFAIMRTDSLNIAMGGTTGKPIPFPPLMMFDPDTMEPNHHNVATHCALMGETINIPDAYESDEFDFSGTKKFDQGTGYRSKSFLTVPLKNHERDVIGVLQLLNAQDADGGDVIAFSDKVQPIVEALASQAAVALENQQLLQAQRDLLEAFIKVIANAIDRKSPYTGGHCQRVPIITEMLAEAANGEAKGVFEDFDLDDEGMYELRIAAWLHDCGKVTTPEYVVDKATKLETIYDRINTVRTRFEVLRRDAEIAYLRAGNEEGADAAALKIAYDAELASIESDLAFIETANIGGEFMDDADVDRINHIAKRSWRENGEMRPFLTENEVYNLTIRKGTLTTEERQIINDHIVVTLEMLSELPFPKNLRKVPEYAGGHHEKMDGTGYPNGLRGDEMSAPARMMAIADIFEALTARDRPYKKAKKLSEAVHIMSLMCKEGHIDPELFDLFLRSGVHMRYANEYLPAEQIDEVDIRKYLPVEAPAPIRRAAAG